MWKCSSLTVAVVLLLNTALFAQPKPLLIDQVIAVVGREAILHSELVVKVGQAQQQEPGSADPTCEFLEDLLYAKLLVEQGKLDSVVVDEARVDQELDRRIGYYAQQLGGEAKLEEFYGKTITEIKAEFRIAVEEQLLVQQMQERITSDLAMTPREVKQFFDRIPEDSIPLIGAEVEYAMLLRIPKPNEDEERRVRRKMEEFREAIVKGEKEFCTVAILYSEDPGSAKECGELGMVPTGVMVPEFDAVAVSLKEGEVSQVFKTQYGWHFMQMIERRGEQYSARHVLMRPQVSSADLQQQKAFLDSLRTAMLAGKPDFGTACAMYSDDEESKGLNGMMIEPNSNSARWDISDLDQQVFFVLDKLKPGEMSEPQLLVLPDGSKAYRILKLNVRTDPHRATLREDYRLIQQAAEGKVRSEMIERWITDHIGSTYVRVSEDYAACTFVHPWMKSQEP
ncbi:MAG: peptidylprolyl isomerase [Flavobacteriales bacterium]|nr:peptidylprolyl isomerase [Flavobacteriales bacterium]MBP7408687.1 peptidylprolyl isomerase [Flavobacteriales bacterium]